MRLTRVKVTNHSRLADLDFEVREHLVLVGPNDAGKSSLLRCLDFLLGASTAQLYSRLRPEDFRDIDQPLVIEADLAGFQANDEALFPDEITVNPGDGARKLTVRLVATVDSNQSLSIERTAPDSGTRRQLSRDQLDGIGWNLLSTTATTRELRSDRRSVVDEILQSVDLGDERGGFDALADQLRAQLEDSEKLGTLRGELAGQLTRALPEQLAKDDLAFVPGATATNDVLSDVRLQVTKNGSPRHLAEQSDGMRALFALALYDHVRVGANMVAIDEPEVHLHPTSQRNLARLLQSGPNQKLLATHSADIVSAFPPEHIVVVRAGGVLVQPRTGFLSDDERMVVRWWVRGKLEPLTARGIIAVEGISDRIIVERVADLTGRNLDRLGIAVIETDGAGDMAPVYKLFGPSGFDIQMSMLIDEDATKKTADKLGIAETALAQRSVWVSDPDLEAEYVAALGADAVWQQVQASRLFTRNELACCAVSGPNATRTDKDVAAFCRRKNDYKVRAAMAVASVLDATTAAAIGSINKLLSEMVTV